MKQIGYFHHINWELSSKSGTAIKIGDAIEIGQAIKKPVSPSKMGIAMIPMGLESKSGSVIKIGRTIQIGHTIKKNKVQPIIKG